MNIKIGDVVSYKGRLYENCYGRNPGAIVTGEYEVTDIAPGQLYGIRLGQSGWGSIKDCTVMKKANETANHQVKSSADSKKTSKNKQV